jgi:hypothetical protein
VQESRIPGWRTSRIGGPVPALLLFSACVLLGYKRSSVASWVSPKLGALPLPVAATSAQLVQRVLGGVSVVLGGLAVVLELRRVVNLGRVAFDALSEDVHKEAQRVRSNLKSTPTASGSTVTGSNKAAEIHQLMRSAEVGLRAAAMSYELSADPRLAFSVRIREEVADMINGFATSTALHASASKDIFKGCRVLISGNAKEFEVVEGSLVSTSDSGPASANDLEGRVVQLTRSYVKVKDSRGTGKTAW